jgi:hypothetical protein
MADFNDSILRVIGYLVTVAAIHGVSEEGAPNDVRFDLLFISNPSSWSKVTYLKRHSH